MELEEVLIKSGLNEKEAKVYLAMLELGPSTAYRIAPKAGIKRPITYVVLENLQSKGLVSTVPEQGKKLFVAADPNNILGEMERTKDLYKRFLPNLAAIYADEAKKEKPQVQFFEGREAVYEIYEKIYQAKEVMFFSTIKDILTFFPDYPEKLNAKASAGKMRVRELLTRSESDFAYARTMNQSKFFEDRFAPGAGEFFTDNCLFDGQAAFFSYEPFIFAVLIRSEGIYKSLKTLFELTWSVAQPLAMALENKVHKG